MGISEEVLAGEVYRVALSGRMDIQGVGEIETRFAGMTASPRMRVVVDLSDVPFMSSIGIRALMINAKAVARRGGRFLIAAPQAQVREVLETAGLAELVSILATLDEAIAAVKA